MANRYWVGGTGTWSASSTTNWSASSGGPSGASVPTAADSVFFDQAATYTVTMSGVLNCLDITISAGTVTMASTLSPTLAIAGNFSVIAGTVWSSIAALTFTSTTTGKTINSNGVTITATNGVTFNGVGGGWTLGGAFTTAVTGTTTLTAGALDLANFTWTTGIFSSNNSNTRSVAFGTGNIALAHTTAAQTVLAMNTLTGFTWTGTGGFTSATNVTKTIQCGSTAGTITSAPNLSFTAGAGVITFGTTTWVNTLSAVGSTSTFNATGAQTNVNFKTLILAGGTYYINSTPTQNVTITGNGKIMSGTLTVNNAAVTVTLDTSGGIVGASTLTISAGKVMPSGTGSITCTAVNQSGGEVAIDGSTWTTSGTYTYTGGTITDTGGGTLNTGDSTAGTGAFVLNYAAGTLSLPLSPTSTFTVNNNFTHTAGALVLTASVNTKALAATRALYTLTTGTITLNNNTLTVGNFSSSNTNTRSVAFGSGFISIAATGGLAMADATNFTYTGTGGFSMLGTATTGVYQFGSTAGGSTTNAPNFTISTGSLVPTITTGSWFKTLDFGTSSFTASATNLNLINLTLSSTGTYSSLTATMVGTGTITPNGKSLAALTINHSGTTTLAAALTVFTTGATTLTSGTLDLAGFTLTTGVFVSDNTNTRAIAFGSGNIATATTTAGAVNISMATATNFTWTGTGGFTSTLTTTAVTRTFTFGSTAGGSTTNAPNLSLTTGGAIPTFTSGSWFKALNFTGSVCTPAAAYVNVDTLTLATGGTYTALIPVFTRTQTWTPQFSKQLGGIGVNGTATLTLESTQTYTATSICYLLGGTLDLGGANRTFGTFSSNTTNARVLAFGSNNLILATTTAGSVNIDAATATGFTWTGTGGFTAAADITRTYTFGTTGGTITNAPNLTFTGSGVAVQTLTTGSWFNTVDFGTTAFTLAATAINFNTFTLSSGGTFTNLTAQMRGTGTPNFNSKAINTLTINNDVGTTTLAAAASVTTFNMTAGTINFASFNLTCSGTATYTAGTMNNIATISCATWTCAGTFTMTSGTITPSTSFVVTGGFNYNGGTLSAVPTFTHTSGNVTLGKAYALSATGTYTLTAGTLTLSGFDLTTGIFSSTGSGVRTIAFGSNNIILATTTVGATNLDGTIATNFTWTGTGGFTAAADITRTFVFGTTGGSSSNAVNLSFTGSGTAVQTITTGSYFNTLNFGTTAFTLPTTAINVSTLTLSSGGTFTGLSPILTRSQNWTAQYGKQLGGLGFNLVGGTLTSDGTQTFTATAAFTLTAGTLDITGGSLTIGTFSSNNTNTRSIAFGSNNIILTTTTAGATNIDMATATGFSYTGTGGFTAAADITRTFTFGTTGGTSANSPNLSFTGSGTAVQTLTSGSYFGTLNFGTTAFNPGTTSLNIDSITLSSGGTFTGLTVIGVGTGTITPNSKPIAALTINAGTTDVVTLGGAVTFATATAVTTLTQGTLALNGNNLTTGTFSSSNTNTRSIAFGSNNIILSTTTLAQVNLSMATATGFTWTGTGGFTAAADITRTFTFGTTGGTTDNSPNLSFTGSGTAVQTLTTLSYFGTLNFGTTAFDPGAITLYLNSLVLSASGTYGSLLATMVGTGTITSNGNSTLGGLVINSTGTTSLASAFSIATTGATTLNAGTINLNGFNLTTGTFSSSNSNTRSVAFGNNYIILATTTASAAALGMATAAGFTCTGAGGFSTNMSVTRIYRFGSSSGGSADNAPNLFVTGGASEVLITTGSWFNVLDFTGSTSIVSGATTGSATTINVDTLTLATGGTYANITAQMTGTGTITGNGKAIAVLTVDHAGTTTLGSALTVVGATNLGGTSTPTLNLGGFDLTTGNFTSSFATTRTVAFGSNYIITTTSGILMSDATNFTYTGTGGFKGNMASAQQFAFGVTGGSASNAPDLYIYTGSQTATITTGSWFRKIDCTGSTSTVPTTSATARTINVNNLILASGGTYTSFIANMVGTSPTINGNSAVINTLLIPDGSTVTMTSALGVGTYIQVANTTLDMGTFAFTATTTIDYNGGTILNPGTISCTTFTSNGTYTVSSGTLTASTSIVVTGGFNYTGGTLSAVPTFTHTSGNVTFGKSYALTATGTYTLTAGALDIGGFTLTTGIFSSGNTNVRSIAFGSGSIVLAHTSAGTTCLNMSQTLGLTCTGTGGFSTNMSVARAIRCGSSSGTIDNAPNFFVTGGASEINIGTGAIFNKLDLTGSTCTVSGSTAGSATVLNAASVILASGGTYTNITTMTLLASGTLTCNGKSLPALVINHAGTTTLGSAALAGTYTQTAGDVDFATFNMTCTGAVSYTAGTLTNVGTITCTTWTCAGTFTMTNGTITPSTSFVVNGGNFNYNGGTLSPVGTFTQTLGNVTLGKAYALTATGSYGLTAGTLDLGGFDLTTGTFSSSGSGTRTIAFGSSNIVLATTTAAATNLSMANITGLTCTGTGGFTAAADITRTFTVGTGGGTIASAPKLTLTGSGTAVQTFTTGGYFDKLDFGTTAFNPGTTALSVNNLTLSSGGTFTALTVTAVGTGTITANGKTIAGFTINASGATITLGSALAVTATTGSTTLTTGALVLNGFDLSTGIFNSTNSSVRSIAFGSNVIALSGTATPLNMANAQNFSCTGTGGFTSDASATKIYNVGTTGAPTVAPNLTLTGAGTSVQTFSSGGYFGTLNFGITAFTVGTTSLNLYGLTLSTGGTFTNITPTFVGTGTINGNGKTLPTLTLNHTGTTTLSGALTVTGATTFNSTPTLALGGQTLTTGSFSSTGTGARAITGSGTISVGDGWTVTTGSGFTGTGYSIKMTKATTKTFAGGGGTYGTLIQNGAGALTITGSNTFDDIQVL